MKQRYWLRVGSGLMAIGLAATFGACGDSSPDPARALIRPEVSMRVPGWTILHVVRRDRPCLRRA